MSEPSSVAIQTSMRFSVPSSFSQVGTVTKYELLNYFRSRRFFILLIIQALIGGLLTTLVGYYRPDSFVSTALGFYSSWLGLSVNFLLILSGIFFGGDAISGEFQNKTGYFLVANPLRRSSIYVGKYLGALTASVIVLLVYLAITLGNGLYYFGANVPSQMVEALAFSLLYLISVLGFTFFFSSLFKSSSMSILVTAILFLFVFPIIQTVVVQLIHIEPWFLIIYGSQIITNVLIDPYPTTVTTRTGFGPNAPSITQYAVTIPEGVAIMIVYFIATAILGLVLFERKEFT